MCRPNNNSTKKQRRVSMEDLAHADRYINQKVALHQECQTASTTSTSFSEDSLSISSHHYPVTGRYSDINVDYSISTLVFGSGHFGTVRQAIHRATGQTYAVKSIEKSKVGRTDDLQREIQLLSMMNHENVMNMVDCYEDENYVHIVTEEYTGGELFDKIIDNTSSNGCLSETEAARIIEQLLKAVSYLHDMDVCHRDIKPENILFESKDAHSSIRLIDFGLSRTHSMGDEMMSNPVGTAYYMSPELLKGQYDRATDMWSVGVVAYILLCGYPPFNGDTDGDIVSAIRRGHYTFVDGWDGKSVEALDFIKCLLRRDPRRRYTAKDALKHPWLKNASVTPMEL
jgi:serine/threonine protein kinase